MKNAMSVSAACKSYLRILSFLSVFIVALAVQAQSVTWQILPWPSNSNWGGPRGNPAVTNGDQIILTGQDVLSVQSFTAPLTITYDVVLPAKTTTDGFFLLQFVPPGEPTNLLAEPFVLLDMAESQAGNDYLEVQENLNTDIPWGPTAFSIQAGTVYHISVTVAANGVLSWTINGQDMGLGNSVVIPYSSFQFRLTSWQPTQVWQISNFTVSTAPVLTCPSIIGTWTGQVNVAVAGRGFQATALSLQVTDQNTNSCLLQGYIKSGSAPSRGPWGYFNPGNWWGNVPFTGTILDTTGVILNFGIFGQASATLDMSQTPPVMKKFILLSTAGAASGDTAVGDLTEKTSGP